MIATLIHHPTVDHHPGTLLTDLARVLAPCTCSAQRTRAERAEKERDEARAASEKAWDEGQISGWDEAQRTWQETGGVGDGWKHSTDPNPYRGEQTNG